MNVKLLNPFVQAAVEVLKAEVGADVTRGEITLQKSSHTSDDITVLINLIGDVYGVVMYGMPMSTGLDMVSSIMGQKFAELNPLAQSGVAELGNVISGRATIRFSEAGYRSNISTPTILIGSGVQISTLRLSSDRCASGNPVWNLHRSPCTQRKTQRDVCRSPGICFAGRSFLIAAGIRQNDREMP